ncbi:MAG: hypothetical protein MR564_00005, partial [Paraprevotella sp.]|nr:hypothetical protein [Paraprevotella sp.]
IFFSLSLLCHQVGSCLLRFVVQRGCMLIMGEWQLDFVSKRFAIYTPETGKLCNFALEKAIRYENRI